jgi:hypothetical protein
MSPRLTSNCFADPAWRAPGPRPNGAERSRNAFPALVASSCGAVFVEFVDIFILTLIRDPLVELLDLIEDRLLKPWHRKKSVARVAIYAA